jgi:hypothetical protein
MANEFKIKNGLIVSGSADFEQDLRVRGTLTVDELHTSITTSSILYESGSTVFGNTLDDTHQLTGSVAITGAITLNGQAIGTGKLDESTFNSFTSSYTTGAFTGSFKGDGSQLYNIPSSGVTGLNLNKIISGSVSASISPDRGLEINTNTIISGALSISGTTTLGGNIVPLTPRGATLGTLELPFADIFVSSGSINIAGIVGQPNTTLSNVSGNILISAGGMQLVGSGAFNAATGSFQFISGSMEQVGDYIQTGDYELLGNKSITGSLNLSGSLNISSLITGATTDNIVTYNPTTKAVGSITGLTASQIPVRYYGAFYDLTTQTGSTNVSGSVMLGNTQNANGVSVVSGSRITVANAGVYNLQFSTQLYRSQGGTTVNTYFWFRINGVNVTNSNTMISTMTNNNYTVASWNYVDVYNAGDYVELMWMPTGQHVSLEYINSPAGLPSIPSVILTLTQV